jgi:hypothetical protein
MLIAANVTKLLNTERVGGFHRYFPYLIDCIWRGLKQHSMVQSPQEIEVYSQELAVYYFIKIQCNYVISATSRLVQPHRAGGELQGFGGKFAK